MCNFQVWFQSEEDVYVLQCTDCYTFQVRLHNASFVFDPSAYMVFRHAVERTWRKIESGDKGAPIIIPTLNSGMDLLLNIDQFSELYNLLDAADTEIQAARMSSYFYQWL